MLLLNRSKAHQLAQQAIELSFAEGATGAYGQTYSCTQSGLAITYLRTGILWIYSAGSLVMEYNTRTRKAVTVRTGKWMHTLAQKASVVTLGIPQKTSTAHFTWTELAVALCIWSVAATMSAGAGNVFASQQSILAWSQKSMMGMLVISCLFVAGRLWTVRRT